MTVIAIVPALVAIIGAALYLMAANPKAAELGRIAFFCGLLVLMFALAGHVLRFG